MQQLKNVHFPVSFKGNSGKRDVNISNWASGKLSLTAGKSIECTFCLPSSPLFLLGNTDAMLRSRIASCEPKDEDHSWNGRKGQILEVTLLLSIPTQAVCTFLHYVWIPFFHFGLLN